MQRRKWWEKGARCTHSDPTGQLFFPVPLSRHRFWRGSLFGNLAHALELFSNGFMALDEKRLGTCPATVHFSTSKLLNHLKNLQLHFNDTILTIALRETS